MIGESIEESDKWKITDSAVAPGGSEGHTASYKTRSIWGQENVSSFKEKKDRGLISTMIKPYSVLSVLRLIITEMSHCYQFSFRALNV